MIKMHGTRKRGPEFFSACPEMHERPVEDAFRSLVEFELGYGGRVKEVTECSVVVETHILGCVDTTYYSGSEEEMAPLVAIACAYEQVLAEENKEVAHTTYEQMKKAGDRVAGSPFFVANLAPILMGRTALHRAADRLASIEIPF